MTEVKKPTARRKRKPPDLFGKAVIYNGGEAGQQERCFAFITQILSNGNAIVLYKTAGEGGWEQAFDVPRRARKDYGPEGGGHTYRFHGE
jgi:hypothetical protein